MGYKTWFENNRMLWRLNLAFQNRREKKYWRIIVTANIYNPEPKHLDLVKSVTRDQEDIYFI